MNPLASTADSLIVERPERSSTQDDGEHVFQFGRYVFKRLDSADEIEQIHRLNYQTFVREVRQYSAPETDRLIDKFHDKNQYFVALRDQRVVGMISAHDQPPFSIASRLEDPSVLSRPGMRLLEVRLLAVDPSQRNGTVFAGLVWSVHRYARRGDYTHIVISGLDERKDLYARLGFVPLGAPVPGGEAAFVPMITDLESLPPAMQRDLQLWERRLGLRRSHERVCLLPGPVQVSAEVRSAFCEPPISHRSPEFIDLFQRTRTALGEMTAAHNVAIFNGSGSLANDVIAATLAADRALQGEGLILVNGEFGHRLCGQAQRFALPHRVLQWPWGQPWDLEQVDAALARRPAWVWATHLETSTGVLNDLAALTQLARSHGVPVCADCISSLGAVPLDLNHVHLASGTSGKSIGAFAGLAIVFASDTALQRVDSARVPAYFDLSEAVATVGPRFTYPSPPVKALDVALRRYATPQRAQDRYDHHAEMGKFMRDQLRLAGIAPLAEEADAAPVCATFEPPGGLSAAGFVAQCDEWGFEIAGSSAYLAKRGWVQVATMGQVAKDDCLSLFKRLRRWCA